MLKPKSTEEVSKILAHCNQRRLAVCPQVSVTQYIMSVMIQEGFIKESQ